jgi:hypothetical protein
VDTQEQEQTLIIQPKLALYILGGMGIVVLILSIIAEYLKIFPNSYTIHFPLQTTLIDDFITEFDFTGRPNIAIFFNMLILDTASILAFIIAYLKNISRDKYRLGWVAMAWIVWFLAIDNLAWIIERMNAYFKELIDAGGGFKYDPLTAGVVAVIILAALSFRFWMHLDNKYKVLFLISAVLYFGGEIGKELINLYGPKKFVLIVFSALEQALHYGGATLLVYSLLLYIGSYFSGFSVSTNEPTDINTNVLKITK